ncbi:MAG: sulfotransferase family protein [Candidatus Electrothrix aestuarii]|uniref:Sulfotransferase family protein n=1 Tax=Candidatus Electrothrix aestuarii TaxID=3062594 RepID=A0AAU8LZG4_9BACT|nr:sulfotransferase [Candidatus Electrothrix aestuarii]
MEKPKIFGIGLNKTGTTTLGQCGEILGLRCTGCNPRLLEDFVVRNDFSRIVQHVSRYDLFEDWPWPLIYKQLDEMFPGSKFILTVRSSAETWLESLKKHSMRTHPTKHCRKLAYNFNFPHKHEKEHVEFYIKHNDCVRSYFDNRRNDFVELCWENGDGFEKLCNFLGYDVPDVPFPHANKGINNQVGKRRLLTNKLLSKIDRQDSWLTQQIIALVLYSVALRKKK